jgi:hypothetical protein
MVHRKGRDDNVSLFIGGINHELNWTWIWSRKGKTPHGLKLLYRERERVRRIRWSQGKSIPTK